MTVEENVAYGLCVAKVAEPEIQSRVAEALGKVGICVWDGHFYAARAVEILGLGERGGLLRTGVSMYSSREDIERLLSGLAGLERR